MPLWKLVLVLLGSIFNILDGPLWNQLLKEEEHQVGESFVTKKLLEHRVGDYVGIFLEEYQLMHLPPTDRIRTI